MQVISFGSKASMATNAAKAGAKKLHKAPAKEHAAPKAAVAHKPAAKAGVGHKLDKHG